MFNFSGNIHHLHCVMFTTRKRDAEVTVPSEQVFAVTELFAVTDFYAKKAAH